MSTLRLSLYLVLRQLRHEWLAAGCLCIAISAALIPLLMVLGLKEGTVATLRGRLAADPLNLEVRLPNSSTYSTEQVAAVQALPQVGFCVPSTRLLATSAMLSRADAPKPAAEVSLIPTAPGDPLLLRHNISAPAEHEIVISHQIAEKLNISIGDTARLEAVRYTAGKAVRAAVERRVAGILPKESSEGVRCYVPLSLLIAVEEYKECTRSALEGAASGVQLQPVFYGFIVDQPGLIPGIQPSRWAHACMFSDKRPLTAEERTPELPEEACLYYSVGQFTTRDKLRSAYSLLRPKGANMLLWNPPLSAHIQAPDATWQPVQIYGRPEQPSFTAPWPQLVLRTSLVLPEPHALLRLGESTVRIALEHDASLPENSLVCSASVLGMLHQAAYKQVRWDAEQQCLLPIRRTFSRIRLYAKGLDDVLPLSRTLQQMGYHTEANIAGIERVRILDAQLDTLFRLLAVIAIAGAAFSLALSLFNSVLKRRRDYAILSTMGFSHRALALFPLCESLILTGVSLLLSFGIFHLMSGTIALLFSGVVEGDERLCTLSGALHGGIVLVGILVAVLSAAAAAVTILRVQPSTAIRES